MTHLSTNLANQSGKASTTKKTFDESFERFAADLKREAEAIQNSKN